MSSDILLLRSQLEKLNSDSSDNKNTPIQEESQILDRLDFLEKKMKTFQDSVVGEQEYSMGGQVMLKNQTVSKTGVGINSMQHSSQERQWHDTQDNVDELAREVVQLKEEIAILSGSTIEETKSPSFKSPTRNVAPTSNISSPLNMNQERIKSNIIDFIHRCDNLGDDILCQKGLKKMFHGNRMVQKIQGLRDVGHLLRNPNSLSLSSLSNIEQKYPHLFLGNQSRVEEIFLEIKSFIQTNQSDLSPLSNDFIQNNDI